VDASLNWLRALAGRFVVFEGPDGSGKTTQYRRLVAAAEDAGVTVCEVREPGGTAAGEAIRRILLDRAHTGMSLRCEMMLYMASRAELVEQRILPAMGRGELVLADRFVPSTLAYQGTAGGVPIEDIQAVAAVATHGVKPDLVVIFDVDEHTAAHRMSPLLDRMEAKGREFHRRVRDGYLTQARENPDLHLLVDANAGEEAVWQRLVEGLVLRTEPWAPKPGAQATG
jgi:dTMP kinase